MNIVEHERDKYSELWALDVYAQHSPGERYLPLFLDMAKPAPGATVLDAGCGAGKGALALAGAGFEVTGCDVADASVGDMAFPFPFFSACLWDELRSPDEGHYMYVYCTDVLEHIPTALTMLVVSRLLDVALDGVFLSVSFVPDVMGAWIGESLHQTVQPFTWWRDHLAAVGEVIEARDLLNAGIFFVRHR